MMNEIQQSNSVTIANSEVLRNHNATSNQYSLLQFQYFSIHKMDQKCWLKRGILRLQ